MLHSAADEIPDWGTSVIQLIFFFFSSPRTSEIYTLSLHDALPISGPGHPECRRTRAISSTVRNRATRRRSRDRKSTRLNSSHVETSYAVFCLKKKKHLRTEDKERHQRDAAAAEQGHIARAVRNVAG